ncbi:MAG: hypothetical protein M1354_02880 [Candidatus Marsarchaeota archaeon]|nr:hypothetical protein [Candidatus Marsarchaeota archaeon]
MMRRFVYLAALLLLSSATLPVLGVLGAAPASPLKAGQLETPVSGFTSWLPVIILAIMLSMALVSAYYMIGVILDNVKVKGQAKGEFYQAIGTMVLVIIILFIFGIFGTSLTSTSSLAASPASINTICNQLKNSPFQFTSSTYASGRVDSPTNLVCKIIAQDAGYKNGIPTETANLDYGLAATYVIAANETNQTLNNLNALYFFEGESGYLRAFTSVTVFCVPAMCAIPVYPDRIMWFSYTYMPFEGYQLQRAFLPPVETMATLTFYLFLLQMTIILLLLYAWPAVLAAGIVLRTFSITRRAGGFMIALVIVVLIIYPIVVLFEYTSLGNGNALCQYASPGSNSNGNPNNIVGPGSQTSPTFAGANSASTNKKNGNCIEAIGTNSIPSMVIPYTRLTNPVKPPKGSSEQEYYNINTPNAPPADHYNLNFYVMPNLAWVLNYYGCYPNGGNSVLGGGLLSKEIGFASWYLIPGYGLYQGLTSGGGGGGPLALLTGFFNLISNNIGGAYTITSLHLPPGYTCFTPKGIITADIAVVNVYGVEGVTGFVIPLLNVLILISGILGLSGLLGGDTNLVGMARFI